MRSIQSNENEHICQIKRCDIQYMSYIRDFSQMRLSRSELTLKAECFVWVRF